MAKTSKITNFNTINDSDLDFAIFGGDEKRESGYRSPEKISSDSARRIGEFALSCIQKNIV